ncbi:hypothetical protein THAOC_19688 [Thalassiosira oceanica]|uniref:Uncharacterized protein n=1 Tax=Thalassiosira oceanica TaxID=159749 RepID=K0S1Q7_THAOC|nr:hypothetical protein THAOC_19688 [Thalassiosira oceanica]|eukprot:EJK60028.1 hypothetical protein THAOC_19688 [Thalassiosira oceanica]
MGRHGGNTFCLLAVLAGAINGFSNFPITSLRSHVDNNDRGSQAQALVSLVRSSDETGDKDEEIRRAVSELEALPVPIQEDGESDERFKPLLGLYQVDQVLSTNKKENPVGGKWTRNNSLAQMLFKTRATFQHILPLNSTGLAKNSAVGAVAEAINVISLDALGGMFRIWIVLRAVRALFDQPFICFAKRKRRTGEYSHLPIRLGPESSVVLDTTYCDDCVRIGMGGTSGTRFVFTRTEDETATEFESLLSLRTVPRWKLLRNTGLALSASMYAATGFVGFDRLKAFIVYALRCTSNTRLFGSGLKVGLRTIGVLMSILSGMAFAIVAFGSGGVEGIRRESNIVNSGCCY